MINLEKVKIRRFRRNIAGKPMHLPSTDCNSEYNRIFMAFAKDVINVNGKLVSPYKH